MVIALQLLYLASAVLNYVEGLARRVRDEGHDDIQNNGAQDTPCKLGFFGFSLRTQPNVDGIGAQHVRDN